jgi:hypothetical protein
LNDDGSCGCCGEAGLVGGDVVNRVGCDLGRVDDDVAYECAVEIGLDAEVEVGLRACDRGAEVVVRVPYLDDGGVIAVDVDRGRRVGRVRNRGGGFGKIWRRCDVPSDTPYADIIPGAQIAIPCLSTFWVIWHALDEVAVGFEGVRVASRLGATFGLCSMEVAVGATARLRAAYSIAVGWFSRQFPEPRKERYAVHEFKLCRQKFFNKRVCS